MDQLKSILNDVKMKELEKKRKWMESKQQAVSSTSNTTVTSIADVQPLKKYARRKDLEGIHHEMAHLEGASPNHSVAEKLLNDPPISTSGNLAEKGSGSRDQLLGDNEEDIARSNSQSTSNLSLSQKSKSSQHQVGLTSATNLPKPTENNTATSTLLHTGTPPSRLTPTQTPATDRMISAEDVIRRFRLRGHPIRLFGETDQHRILRLHQLEASVEEGKGQRNEYAKQLAKTEAGLALAFLQTSSSHESKKNKSTYKPDYDVSLLQGQLFAVNPDLCFILVYVYLRRLLDLWETELDARPDQEKRSTSGKHDYTKFIQTKENLKPFFKLLKRKAVENDVIEKIAEILGHVQQREYVKAYDAYLQLSIGNAPWPIGVTMVGIHERSAREKIFSNQVAHVLNDETQRKWIQSIKRIMTFSQQKFPPEDPTKLVG